MPRQTNQVNTQFPDGCKIEISTDGTTGSEWEDIGVLAGGVVATLNWDDYYLDGGNYEGLVDKAKNPVFAIAPSAVLNWDHDVTAHMFPGLMSTADASETPVAGDNVTYAGTSNQVTLTRSKIRLTHYSVAYASQADQYIEWQFTLHNAKIDAGATFNWKGVADDGLDEITVSFSGRPDPASSYVLFTLFEAS